MRILALEFSTSRRSTALVEEGRVLCRETEGTGATDPSVLIRSVLEQAQLTPREIGCLAVGVGPGSYTGIRVAIAVAQGWELALRVRLLGVSSMEAMVWRAWLEGKQGEWAAVVDAQRGEFYAARYRVTLDGVQTLRPMALVGREAIANWVRHGVTLVGVDLPEAPWPMIEVRPEAGMLGVLAWGRTDYVDGSKLEPIYLREASFVKAPAPRPIPPLTRPRD